MTDDLSRLRAENERIRGMLEAQTKETRFWREQLQHDREVNEKLAGSNVRLRAEAVELRQRLENLERNNDALTKNNLRLSKMVRDALKAVRSGDVVHARAVLEETK